MTVRRCLGALAIMATVVPTTLVFGTSGVASAYVPYCQLTRNWVNPNGPTVQGAGCGYPYSYGDLYATWSDGPSYVTGWWWNNAGYWVQGSRGYEVVADDSNADVLLIDYCYECNFHIEDSWGAWITTEF
jgi:hypothetical protein